MKPKSIFSLIVVALLFVGCQKQDRKVKRYIKNMVGDYAWSGYYFSNPPIVDSGRRIGYASKKSEISFNAPIGKGKGNVITFLNADFEYTNWDYTNNALTFSTNSSRLIYYINADSFDYFSRLSMYESQHLHTK